MTNFRPSRRRDAWATIRGYTYQVDLTMMRWLDLQSGQILVLEHGEDIDLISQALEKSGKSKNRLLEQVKHREASSLTLRSTEAITAIANAFEHRTSNPDTILIFRYTTNARIGHEQRTPLLSKQSGIHVWKQICEGHMLMPAQRKALRGLRTLLDEARKPDDIPISTWEKFRSFLQNSNDDQFLAFIQTFEWSVGNASAHQMQEIIQRRLIDDRYASDLVEAQEQYQRLFLHIFQALSRPGMKQLTVEKRNYQLSLPLLSKQERILLDSIKKHLRLIEQRVDVLEQDQFNIKAQVQQIVRDQDKERFLRLRSMLVDQSGFMHDRLSSFVGRVLELKEIQKQIAKLQLTGGYLTITGQAGQGKSSIIAKLIQMYERTNTVFHFIPLNSGPDYQVMLLRNIIAQLILKHSISEIPIEGEQRAILRNSLSRLLTEIASKKGREIIFIDGLDQLQEEYTGTRDLSFLPTTIPPGIVFVLGTRPNDTLEPLKLLKPIEQYQVPSLSRQDFDLILLHRHLSLESRLVDQFYDAMQANALFLDLVARELQEKEAISPQDMIDHIAHNPENLFSLAIARLKRQSIEWREVIKPVLGLLLVAQEPLFIGHMKQILRIEHDRLWDAITRLGGLLTEGKQRRYSLFHLKLHHYLHRGEDQSSQEYIFDTEDVAYWHNMLTQWCERERLSRIWENARDSYEEERRRYARQYYLLHLYYAQRRERLFEVLDEYHYGQAKVQSGPGMPSYISDLDLGRQAAIEEGVKYLPHLWRYTLLRSSIFSLADNYPDTAFSLLLLLKRVPEAIGFAELLTDPYRKVRVSLLIARHIIIQPSGSEGLQILMRAFETCLSVKDNVQKSEILCELGKTLAQAELWEKAEEVLEHIMSSYQRAIVLGELGRVLAKVGQQSKAEEAWKRAEEAFKTVQNKKEKLEAAYNLGVSLAKAKQWERAKYFFEEIKKNDSLSVLKGWQITLLESTNLWIKDENMEKEIEKMMSIAEDPEEIVNWLSEQENDLLQAGQWEQVKRSIINTKSGIDKVGSLSELGKSLEKSLEWDIAEEVWREIKEDIRKIKDEKTKIEYLGELGKSLAQAARWKEAKEIWREITTRIRIIKDDKARAKALSELGLAIAHTQEWERAEKVIHSIEESHVKIKALMGLGSILTQMGQLEKANAIWEEVQALIQTFSDGRTKLWALASLAKALAQAEKWEKTGEIITFIDNVYLKAETQRELAKALAQAEQWEKAEAVIGSIEDRSTMLEGLKDIAILLIQAQEWEKAEEIISSVESRYWQSKALIELGDALRQTGQMGKAEALWKKAEELIQSLDEINMRPNKDGYTFVKLQGWKKPGEIMRSISGRSVKSWGLRGLGKIFGQVQDWERAELVIRSIEDDRTKAEMLGELGGMLVRANKKERAEMLLRDAETLSYTIVDRGVKSWTLRGLGRAFAQMQRWEKAEALFSDIDDILIRIKALRELGEGLAGSGERERARRVWGEVEAMIQALEEEKTKSEAMKELAITFIHAQEWRRAENLANAISENKSKIEILQETSKKLYEIHENEYLLYFVQRAWLNANTRTETLQMVSLSIELISLEPKLGIALFNGFTWVDTFLNEEIEYTSPRNLDTGRG